MLVCTFLSGAIVAFIVLLLVWRLESLRWEPFWEMCSGVEEEDDQVRSKTPLSGSMHEGDDVDGFHILSDGGCSSPRLPFDEAEMVGMDDDDDDDAVLVDPTASMLGEGGSFFMGPKQ